MNNSIKILSDKDHVLQRPATYIGSMSLETFEGFIFNKELQKFEYKQYQKIQAFEKIINEILDNAIDEALRTDFKKANVIEINTDGNYISIKDNGRGVPITKILDDKGDKISQLEAAFTRARAGSNFSDDNRTTIGLNGLGSFCTSVFSKEFNVEVKSQDGTGSLICKDNLSTHKCKIKLNKNTGKTYTEVTFIPDYRRFGLTCFDENHQNLLFTRLINLSVCYPKIKFKYNGQVLYKIKPETYLTYFGNDFEQISDNDKYIIGVLPNNTDNFIHSSYVNGLNIKDGGNHIDFILNEFISRLRNSKTFKKFDITPGDIRNKIQLICIMRNFSNMQFNSQTKEKLTNSFSEIREYFKDIDFDKFVNKLVKNEKITEPIIINYKIKKQVKDQLALKNSVKLEKNFKCDKYLPATKVKKRLFITEGDSASGGLTPSLGREENSFFSTRGVPLNAYTATAKELANNEELTNIIKVLNLDINNKENSISHDCIVLAEDADCDGCFTGETKVKTLEYGDISFSELVNNKYDNFHIFTIENCKQVIKKAHSPRITKYVNELYKITLDSNESVFCTYNHLFMLETGDYIQAKDLKIGQSLQRFDSSFNNGFISLKDIFNFKEDLKDRGIVYQIYNKSNKKSYIGSTKLNLYQRFSNQRWKFSHISCLKNKDFVGHKGLYKDIDSNINDFYVRVLCEGLHDRNERFLIETLCIKYFNSCNNGYNCSQNANPIIDYNKSKEKFIKINNRRKNDKNYDIWYKQRISSSFVKYNKSQKHREKVALMNKDENIKKIQKESATKNTLKILKYLGLELTKKNYNNFRRGSAYKYDKNYDMLKDIYDLIEENDISYLVGKTKDELLNNYNYDVDKKWRTQFVNTCKKVLNSGLELNEKNYNDIKSCRMINWKKSLIKLNLTEECVINYVKNYNHKITNIEKIILDKKVPVYDLTVDDTHNFCLASNIYVHNSHIRGLYLGFFIKYARHLFEEHKIKYLKTPIAAILEKKNIVKYWFTLSDMNNYLSKHSIKNNQTLKYFKGLGSWRSDLLSNLINNNGGIENFLEEFEISEDSEKLLIDWIGESKENVQSRKEYLKDYQLDINKI